FVDRSLCPCGLRPVRKNGLLERSRVAGKFRKDAGPGREGRRVGGAGRCADKDESDESEQCGYLTRHDDSSAFGLSISLHTTRRGPTSVLSVREKFLQEIRMDE